ncbi:hypothetical protein [Nannocystis bainbridge]|uniref:Uncharacterized protein n=1 Tax=Nannocystis bainbridge TaxID=2995303 RepID=A0ABT5E126_9BACT|nr:hypothetical protein [Nannocystis bainbridge]MDC0719520.1 hypothetical protein [Nannocystis bainbridge]
MTGRTPKTHTLAAAAAFAAILQLVATLELSLSSDAAVMRAAREGPTIYLLTAAVLAIGGGVVAWQRHRPPLVCVALGLPAVVIAALLVRFRGSLLGLAYHGELLLHHFLAALCAAACVAVALGWASDRALGRLRMVPAAPAIVGAGLLLTEHLNRAPDSPIGLLGQVGTVSLLLAAPLALAALWSQLQPPLLRWGAVALLVPLAVRCGLGGASVLSGMPLGSEAAAPILVSVGAAALVGMVLMRPRAERGLHGAALGMSAVACLVLHRGYTQRFGDLEAAVGQLARSLLGFELPYPGYLPGWRIVGGMLTLFVVFALTTTALLSRRDHVRGLCLVILLCAGLGLSTPQLVLMTGAGLLLGLDTLAGAPAPAPRVVAPTRPIEPIVLEAAGLLGLPAPTVLEQERGAVIAVRGEVARVAVDLRARQDRGGWHVVLQAGVLGRGAPDVELVPGRAGDEPHPLVAGHRARGDARRLERLPESLLLALAPFPGHRTRVWPGGVQVELGDRLDALDAAALAAVLRGMSEAT